MSQEQPPKEQPPLQEQFGIQETPEQTKDRLVGTAKRGIKHAFWDFQARGGTDVLDFLERSDEFATMRSKHSNEFKSSVGIKEAIDFIKSLSRKNIPVAGAPVLAETIVQPQATATPKNTVTPVSPPIEDLSTTLKTGAANDAQFLTPENDSSTDEYHVPVATEEMTLRPAPQAESIASLLVTEEALPQIPVPPSQPVTPDVQKVYTPETNEFATSHERSLENQEHVTEYIEGVKNMTAAYTTFIDKLLAYNQTTLDRNGGESSESILYSSDLSIMRREIDEVSNVTSKETAQEAFELIKNAHTFLKDNAFPIHKGMLIGSLEGYAILEDAIVELMRSLSSISQTIKNKDAQQELVSLLEQLDDDMQRLGETQQRKREYLARALSR
jgi:hypothetical protein